MEVEALRRVGLKPSRAGVVVVVERGNGEGMRRGSRSVSEKKPPSMCGRRERAVMRVRVEAGSGVPEGGKAGVMAVVVDMLVVLEGEGWGNGLERIEDFDVEGLGEERRGRRAASGERLCLINRSEGRWMSAYMPT